MNKLLGVFFVALLALVFAQCELECEVPGDEEEVKYWLELLYEETNGDEWTHNDGWLSDDDYCEWYGVTCEDGVLRHLLLQDNNLVGTVPEEIGCLTELKTLYLSHNPDLIFEDNIDWFCCLEALKYFHINHTKLIDDVTIPECLCTHQGIQYFYVQHTHMTGPIPDCCDVDDPVPGGQEFHFECTDMTGDIPEWFKDLVGLIEIYTWCSEFNNGGCPEWDWEDFEGKIHCGADVFQCEELCGKDCPHDKCKPFLHIFDDCTYKYKGKVNEFKHEDKDDKKDKDSKHDEKRDKDQHRDKDSKHDEKRDKDQDHRDSDRRRDSRISGRRDRDRDYEERDERDRDYEQDRDRDYEERDDRDRDYEERDDRDRDYEERDDRDRDYEERDDRDRDYEERDDRDRDYEERDDRDTDRRRDTRHSGRRDRDYDRDRIHR
ncbi:hypothetical protein ADUPG1_013448 [Aduncisulcus paluster]|uniref:Uncharacterized protein n=1 Tax=Aduncisulcus paluster TaxID=2918883 RepID=A0ABQ5K310_9EUKA|nr:hypothetical protein ADUPG1_013448 [Aduncisulcus paluster]